jgi:hypothetical protein
MLLASTEFDAPDELGSLRFDCGPGSDVIEIDGDASDEQRRMLADFNNRALQSVCKKSPLGHEAAH